MRLCGFIYDMPRNSWITSILLFCESRICRLAAAAVVAPQLSNDERVKGARARRATRAPARARTRLAVVGECFIHALSFMYSDDSTHGIQLFAERRVVRIGLTARGSRNIPLTYSVVAHVYSMNENTSEAAD